MSQRTVCKQKTQTFADSVVSQISFCCSFWLNISAWDGGGSGADSATQSSTRVLPSAAHQQHIPQCGALSGFAQWLGISPRQQHPLWCSSCSGRETYWGSSDTASCILWLFQVCFQYSSNKHVYERKAALQLPNLLLAHCAHCLLM